MRVPSSVFWPDPPPPPPALPPVRVTLPEVGDSQFWKGHSEARPGARLEEALALLREQREGCYKRLGELGFLPGSHGEINKPTPEP